MAKRAFARTIRANTTPRFFFQKVGPASFVRSHTPLGVCVGSTVVQGCPLGAVSSAGVLKSKNSFMSREGSFQKASRAVSDGTLKVCSTKARIAVEPRGTREIK